MRYALSALTEANSSLKSFRGSPEGSNKCRNTCKSLLSMFDCSCLLCLGRCSTPLAPFDSLHVRCERKNERKEKISSKPSMSGTARRYGKAARRSGTTKRYDEVRQSAVRRKNLQGHSNNLIAARTSPSSWLPPLVHAHALPQ